MADMLSTLSIISFVICGICLILSVFFWFFFKIPTVIGDLTGRTARKSIARMRAANEKGGPKEPRKKRIDPARRKTAASVSNPEQLTKETDHDRPETGLLSENRAAHPAMQDTGALEETVELCASEEAGLLADSGETGPLNSGRENHSRRTEGMKLTLLDEVMLIHTDEVIE